MTATISLKQIAEISSGQSAPQGDKYFGEKGYPFVRAGSLESLLADGNEDCLEKIDDEVAKEFNLQLYSKGTILFAKSGMSATKDRVYVLKSPCYVVSHLAAIIPKRDIDSTFLKFWFRRFRPSRLIRDKSYPSIRLSDIEEIEIPDLEDIDKKKIASILDKCESARAKRKEANRLTDEFLKSVFLDMFGDPVRNPKKMEIVPLSEIAKITMGQSPPSNTYNNQARGLPFYQGKAEFGEIYPTVKKWCSKPQRCAEKNDILMSVRAPVGPTNLAPTDCCIGRGLCAISGKKVDYLFLFYQLRIMEPAIAATQQGSTFGAIRRQDVEKIKVLYPEKNLQQKFAGIVQKVEKLKEKQRKSEEELNNLFNSLMQKAFKGELS